MVRAGEWEVSVPDSVMLGDPAWSVTDMARCSAYNGEWTAWCLPCAKLLGNPFPVAKARSWWARLLGVVR
jgi:hypothetical protein